MAVWISELLMWIATGFNVVCGVWSLWGYRAWRCRVRAVAAENLALRRVLAEVGVTVTVTQHGELLEVEATRFESADANGPIH